MIKNFLILVAILLTGCSTTNNAPTKAHLRAVVPVTDGYGGGTAFFISEDRLLSAAHVCGNAGSLMNAVTFDVYIVLAIDEARDLCLLKSAYKASSWFELASERPSFATPLVVIGYPYLVGRAVTEGRVVSTLGILPFSMISAQVRPGNSGGPVINYDGEVVGVLIVGHIPTGFGGFTVLSDIKEFLHAAQANN